MNAQASGMFYSFQQPRRMICGVCAATAAWSGIPVWLVRLVALLLLLSHGLLAFALYMCAAAWLRQPSPARPQRMAGDELGDRFARLERRLARMEGAALDEEAGLRRAFRDLR